MFTLVLKDPRILAGTGRISSTNHLPV